MERMDLEESRNRLNQGIAYGMEFQKKFQPLKIAEKLSRSDFLDRRNIR